MQGTFALQLYNGHLCFFLTDKPIVLVFVFSEIVKLWSTAKLLSFERFKSPKTKWFMSHYFEGISRLSCFQQNLTACSVLVLFSFLFCLEQVYRILSITEPSLTARLSLLFVFVFRLRSVGGWLWKSCLLCWCSISRDLFLKRLEVARNSPRTLITPSTWRSAKVWTYDTLLSTPGL